MKPISIIVPLIDCSSLSILNTWFFTTTKTINISINSNIFTGLILNFFSPNTIDNIWRPSIHNINEVNLLIIYLSTVHHQVEPTSGTGVPTNSPKIEIFLCNSKDVDPFRAFLLLFLPSQGGIYFSSYMIYPWDFPKFCERQLFQFQ